MAYEIGVRLIGRVALGVAGPSGFALRMTAVVRCIGGWWWDVRSFRLRRQDDTVVG